MNPSDPNGRMIVRKLALLFIGTCLTLTATLTSAQRLGVTGGDGYIGGAALFWELDPDGGSSFEDTAFLFRFGNRINEYAALESRFGLGGSDSVNGEEFELDLLGSLFISPRLPLSDEFELYGLFGFSTIRGSVDDENGGLFGGGSTSTVSDTDISYGLGAAFRPTPELSIDVDYAVYLDESDYDFSGWAVGLTWYY